MSKIKKFFKDKIAIIIIATIAVASLCVSIPLLMQTPNKNDLAAASGSWSSYAADSYAAGSTDDVLLIETPEQLALFGENMVHDSTLGKTYKLTKDIDMSQHYWRATSTYEGSSYLQSCMRCTFDGQGHTISGLDGNDFIEWAQSEACVMNLVCSKWGSSLCMWMDGGTCTNITFKNCNVSQGCIISTYSHGSYGELENIIVDSCTITGDHAGALATGFYGGTINNCKVIGKTTITGNEEAGGLVAYAYATDTDKITISNCTIGSEVKITCGSGRTSGICNSFGTGIKIQNCVIKSGAVLNGVEANGSAGIACGNGNVNCENCIVEKGVTINAGGNCFFPITSGTSTKCYFGATVNPDSDVMDYDWKNGYNNINLSTLGGYDSAGVNFTEMYDQTKFVNFGDIYDNSYSSAYAMHVEADVSFGKYYGGSLTCKYYGGKAQNNNITGTYIENLKELASKKSWWKDPAVWGEDVWTDEELWWWDLLDWTDWGDDTMFEESKSVYEISNAYELGGLARHFAELATIGGKTIKQTANIDLGKFTWLPMSTDGTLYAYDITFDGQGYAISNLHGENGLFRYVRGGTIKNVTIESGLVNGNISVGGIVGYMGGDGKIENCANYANIIGNDKVGGIVGEISGPNEIVNCHNHGTIMASNGYAGGISGLVELSPSFKNCVNKGDVHGCYAAGIVPFLNGSGLSDTVIDNCINYGNLFGYHVGGIMAHDKSKNCPYKITNCAVFGTLVIQASYAINADESPTLGIFMPMIDNSGDNYSSMFSESMIYSNCYANVFVATDNQLEPHNDFFIGVKYDDGVDGMLMKNTYVVVNGKGYYTEEFNSTDFVVANKINDNLPFISSHFWSGQFGKTIDKTWFEEQGYKAVGK